MLGRIGRQQRNLRRAPARMTSGAADLPRFGPPDVLVLEAVVDPAAAEGQVAIDVEFAGITFVETQIRAGKAARPEMLPRLLADGRNALLLLEAVRIQPGETVLVEAAAGGVGSLLVQLARNAGARVIGAAGGDRKLALAEELGADRVVDDAQPDWTDSLSRELDVVFDGVGGAENAAAAHAAIESRETIGKTLLHVRPLG